MLGCTLLALGFAAVVLHLERGLFWLYFGGSGYKPTEAIVISADATNGENPSADYVFEVDGKSYEGRG